MASKSLNRGLGAAKAAKQDEFYTQYIDIQREVEAFLEFDSDTFRGKVVYCNCDGRPENRHEGYRAGQAGGGQPFGTLLAKRGALGRGPSLGSSGEA